VREHPPNRRFYGKRALLNLPGHESTGAIVAEVEDTSTWKGRAYKGAKFKPGCDIEGVVTLQIANCDRSIIFECSMVNEREQRNSLHKVDTLIGALTLFREGLVIEHARYNRRLAKIAKMNRKRKRKR
jgi:hypothetical protein